ncbi:MAG: hypothetical protein LBV16_08630, partial [Elusimicrobiota bacterium]|nr:hypothetical protein [Elusimicrobiota bacterium]
MKNGIKMTDKQPKINKIISKYVPVCVSVLKYVSVGAGPRVCPYSDKYSVNHKSPIPSLPNVSPTPSFPNVSPIPSFPNVSIGNPFFIAKRVVVSSPLEGDGEIESASQNRMYPSFFLFLSFIFNCLYRLFSSPFKHKLFFKLSIFVFIFCFFSFSSYALRWNPPTTQSLTANTIL